MYGQTPITDKERELAEAVRRATADLAEARQQRDAYLRAQAPHANISDLAQKFDISREGLYKILRTRPKPASAPPADTTSRLNELERLRR